MKPTTRQGMAEMAVVSVGEGGRHRHLDPVAVEEPLEICLIHNVDGVPVERSVAVTMRTPGNDRELAAGFLFSEGIVQKRAWLRNLDVGGPGANCNRAIARLAPEARFDPLRLQRNFYTTSSCGVCSKTSLEALKIIGCKPLATKAGVLHAEIFHQLPERLRGAQSVFAKTGGLHAAGLFDREAKLLRHHEDVGRHNAVDKVIGESFLENAIPLSDSVLMVSGRSSFEILQKALAAGIPVVAAVGAPSTLAIAVARQYRMTLLGFVRDGRFNIYADEGRVALRR